MYSNGVMAKILEILTTMNQTLLGIAEALGSVVITINDAPSAEDVSALEAQLDTQAEQIAATNQQVQEILASLKKKK